MHDPYWSIHFPSYYALGSYLRLTLAAGSSWVACYVRPRWRFGGHGTATNNGSLVSSATVASLTLPFTGVRKCILPWSQTRIKKKNLGNIGFFLVSVYSEAERTTNRVIKFAAKGLFKTKVSFFAIPAFTGVTYDRIAGMDGYAILEGSGSCIIIIE